MNVNRLQYVKLTYVFNKKKKYVLKSEMKWALPDNKNKQEGAEDSYLAIEFPGVLKWIF